MAFMPTLAFTIGGNDATVDTRKLSVTIGRPNEQDATPPGSLTGIINNRHRKWEPGYATGYLPQPGMQALLTATVGTTSYPLFNGRAAGFPQQWQGAGADSYVGFTAIDELSKLSKLKLRGSTLDGARDAADGVLPVAWYSFDKDGASAGGVDDVIVNDSIGHRNGYARGVVDWNQPSLLGSKLGASINLPAGGWIALPVEVGNIIAAGSFVLSFLFRRSENIDRAGETIIHCGNGFGNAFRIVHNPAGKIQAQSPDGTTVSSIYRVGTGITHHIAVAHDGSNLELYVDGVLQGSDTWGGTVTPRSALLIGTNPGGFVEATYADCSIDELMLFTGVFDGDSNFLALSDALKGWPGDRTGTRINRVIAALTNGLGATFLGTTTNVETGQSVLGADGWEEGASALDVIQKIALTEKGRFFINAAGDFVFHQRWRDFKYSASLPTPYGTFTDDPADLVANPTWILYTWNNFGYDYDDRYIINRAEVSTPHEVGPVEASDPTSIAAYTETTKQYTTLARDHNEASAYAQSVIRINKDPRSRVREFSFSPQRQTTWAVALTLGPGALLSLYRHPRLNGVPDPSEPIAADYVVERVRHDIDCMKGIWVTTVFAVELDLQTAPWQLGTSLLGADTVLVF